MKFNLNGTKRLQIWVAISITSLGLLCVSCTASPDAADTESALLMKINAVQEQVMAQGNMTKEEEQAILSLCSIMSNDDGLANFSPDYRMILKDAEMAPVFPGCEELSVEGTSECFNKMIATFIKREFNLNLSKDLNPTEPKQVEAFFIIDENGNRTGMKVRDSEVTIQAEILRVLRKMPVMKPAMHKGVNVAVLCSFILKYGNDIEIDVVFIPERPDE